MTKFKNAEEIQEEFDESMKTIKMQPFLKYKRDYQIMPTYIIPEFKHNILT